MLEDTNLIFKIKFTDDYWAKITLSLIKQFCFNLKEKFKLTNFDLKINYKNHNLLCEINLGNIDKNSLKPYLHIYGEILSRKKPLNILFEGEGLVNFKQSLDLSLLEFKLLKNDTEEDILNDKEIFEIHDNFGHILTNYAELL